MTSSKVLHTDHLLEIKTMKLLPPADKREIAYNNHVGVDHVRKVLNPSQARFNIKIFEEAWRIHEQRKKLGKTKGSAHK